jgi:hypothetical protein
MAPLREVTAPVRETLHIVDPNHFIYEFYETHGGAKQLAVRWNMSGETDQQCRDELMTANPSRPAP